MAEPVTQEAYARQLVRRGHVTAEELRKVIGPAYTSGQAAAALPNILLEMLLRVTADTLERFEKLTPTPLEERRAWDQYVAGARLMPDFAVKKADALLKKRRERFSP